MHISSPQTLKFNVNANRDYLTAHDIRTGNQSNLMLGFALCDLKDCDLGCYNNHLLQRIYECCINQHRVLTPKQYKAIIRTIANLPRPNWQKDLEMMLKDSTFPIKCDESSDIMRDASAAIVLADLAAEVENDNSKINKYTAKEIISRLVVQLKKCGIDCQVDEGIVYPDAITTPKYESKSLGSNEANAERALLKMGKVAGNTNVSEQAAIKKVYSAAVSGSKILPVDQFEAEFRANGVSDDPSVMAINSMILKLAGIPAGAVSLSGVYPVQVFWPPFPFGVDRRTTGLDMEPVDKSQMVVRGLGFSLDDVTDSAKSLLSSGGSQTQTQTQTQTTDSGDWSDKLINAALSLGTKIVGGIADVKIAEAKADIQTKLIQQTAAAQNKSVSQVTQNDISNFTKNNPEKSAQIAAQSMQQVGAISSAEMMKLQIELENLRNKPPQTDWTKIALFSGLGLVSLVAVGAVIYAVRKK